MKIEEVIKQLESIADHTRSMAASPDADEIWKEDIDALEFALTALRSMREAGEPLTVERLREMDGQPVWIEDLQTYSLVSVENNGTWEGVPFVVFTENGVKFTYNIEERGLKIYPYPPAHIDRSKWEPCGACKNDEITIHVPGFRAMAVCNQHMDREAFDVTLRLKFCSWCGRPLTEEAWAELERRVRG